MIPADITSTATESIRPNLPDVSRAFRLAAWGPRGPRTYSLGRGDALTLGRTAPSSVVLEDPSVSRLHAIVRAGSVVTVEDLGSRNGTLVGGTKIAPRTPHPLRLGDTLTIGRTVFVLLADDQQPEQPPSGRAADPHVPPGVIVLDPAMRRLYQLAAQVARSDLNVLLLGETGAGKDALAKMIHGASSRARRPFLSLNCATLSEPLLESELFGHERGAFTGATQTKIGLLEAAPGGTVFLDEVGELPPAVQAKLLCVLEEREIRRVGSTVVRPIDVRFVAATNRDLEVAVEEGRFRGDLYFRLNGMNLRVPPLRERSCEIAPLAMQFLAEAATRIRRPVPRLTEEALALLQAHAWPGNVRELRSAVERALVLCSGDEIGPSHLRLYPAKPAPPPATVVAEPENALAPAGERDRILDALAKSGGNQSRAAEMLGMPRRTFCRRLVEYDIQRPRVGTPVVHGNPNT